MLLLLYSQSYFFYFLKQESHIKQKAHPPTITLNKPVFAAIIIYGEDRLKRQNEIKRRKNFTCKMSVYERIVQYAFLFLEMSEK